MPQRYMSVWMALTGLAGCMLLMALVILGRDALKAAQTGPRWKRNLLAAGLLLLGAETSGCREYGSLTVPTPPMDSAKLAAMPLVDTPQWSSLERTWNAADEIMANKKGPYPFNEQGERDLLQAIEMRKQDVTDLVAAGQLSVSEGDLLRGRLTDLAAGVGRFRPRELKGATCYEPSIPLSPVEPLRRLQDQLPLLEQLAAGDKVHPQVIAKVLVAAENQLAESERIPTWVKWPVPAETQPACGSAGRRSWPEMDKQTALATIAEARAVVARIKARLAEAATQPAR